MPTLEWLKREFHYGYDSGSILDEEPDAIRSAEESAIGGSYREVFLRAVRPFIAPSSRVLELGPGRGSWTRAILSVVTEGEVHTVDHQDVRAWLRPERYCGRLVCHRSSADNLAGLPTDFDFVFSFGVLCHNNIEDIERILVALAEKTKAGGRAVHQYGDWNKLERHGWEKGRIPVAFKHMPDAEIWWPRNDRERMRQAAETAGWEVEEADMGLVERDGIIRLAWKGTDPRRNR